ncbi:MULTISPECIES: hypothetical protein [Nitrospirillum]|uniref:Uncharacterized protein n=1 Tax=Nitrospirillum amazonense TaxID=28077 RepID=A0A560FQG0_9PROT|nr:hypothetical protein [Nitrospirillum amazonense]MEC4592945.1 hypothetical protein [Nitrospirillum amazonense]TWB23859.1 hypothetical protein FBZ88_11329 [Nitrospirillum amazonense]
MLQQIIVGVIVVAALAWVLRPTVRRVIRRRQVAAGKTPGPCGSDSCNCGS